MESQKFWSRVGQWFRKPESATPSTSFDALAGTAPDVPTGPAPMMPVTLTETSRASGLFRRSRSNLEIERLEARYVRVEGLMDAIERHMESQSDRSERIAGALDTLVTNLSGVPEAFRHQSDVLSKIRETMTAEQARAGRIEESLAQWPRLADAQRETMVTISRQLDEAREANTQTVSVVEECKSAFGSVEETAQASTKAIERYAGEATASAQRMALLLEEQARQFQIFAWAAIGLAGVAAVIAVIAMVR